MRAAAPVQWVEEPSVMGWEKGPGYWAVLTHDLVNRVLRDPETFFRIKELHKSETPALMTCCVHQRMMLNQDPLVHTRPTFADKVLTPRAVARLEEGIAERAKLIVDKVESKGHADLHKIAAELLPLTLAEIMGVPEQDRMLLFDWSNRVIGYQDDEYSSSDQFDPSTGTDMARRSREIRETIVADTSGRMPDPRSREGLADMYFYAGELAKYRRRHPGDDVVSILLATSDEQGAITTQEFETMFFLFAVAGNETLRNGIPGGMLALLNHPEQMTILLDNLELLPMAIEEMLRYAPPVIHFRRTATKDTYLGQEKIQRRQGCYLPRCSK